MALKVKVDSKLAEAPVFILELDYAGLFLIQNVPQEQLTALLMIECPRLIFPYVRRIVGDVTRDGGYPPLNLEQIDFLALYRSELRGARPRRPSAGAGLTAAAVRRTRPERGLAERRRRRRRAPRPRPAVSRGGSGRGRGGGAQATPAAAMPPATTVSVRSGCRPPISSR